MSTRVSRGAPPRRAGHNSQRTKVVFDLNVPPPGQSSNAGTSGHAPGVLEGRVGQQRAPPPPVMIDVDSIDDDVVVLSSSRAFVEAKNNPSRNQNRRNVVDLESGSRSTANNRSKRPRIPANQLIINCESYVTVERNGNDVNGIGSSTAVQTRVSMPALPPPQPPPPPPTEATFGCPICIGPLVEEMTTKCGHIFCKACIKKAISVQNKCPTCRKKVTMKDMIRVYLPRSS